MADEIKIPGADVKTPAAATGGIMAAAAPAQAAAQPATPRTAVQPAPGGIVAPDALGPDGFKFREAEAAQRVVDPKTGTVSGQLDSILAKDGVHMQRARANALAMAADAGLRNSSIAVGAAQGALIDRATPIATADAGIYDGASRDNQAAKNAANLANANNYNQLGGIMMQNQFTAKENQLNREQQDRIQKLQEQGMDKRQAEQIAAQERQQRDQIAAQERLQQGQQQHASKESQLNRDQQRELFQKEQDAIDKRATQAFENTLKQLGYQNELANKNIPTQRQAELAMVTTDRINQILADGNLTPEARKGAIQNVIDNANATAAMYEKLYSVGMPKFQTPGAPTNYVQAQPSTPAPTGSAPSGGGGLFGSANLLPERIAQAVRSENGMAR